MDPLEIAKILYAGISAVAAAIRVWRRSSDKRVAVPKAAAQFDEVYQATLASPEAIAAATELVAIIPEDVLRDLENRAQACWTLFRKALDPREYLPDEIDNATEGVQACVCRELSRIRKLNGSIPDKWLPQWQRYDCENREKRTFRPEPIRVRPDDVTVRVSSDDVTV